MKKRALSAAGAGHKLLAAGVSKRLLVLFLTCAARLRFEPGTSLLFVCLITAAAAAERAEDGNFGANGTGAITGMRLPIPQVVAAYKASAAVGASWRRRLTGDASGLADGRAM